MTLNQTYEIRRDVVLCFDPPQGAPGTVPCRETDDVRLRDIEHHDVGMMLTDEPERLPVISDLGHDSDFGGFLQEC